MVVLNFNYIVHAGSYAAWKPSPDEHGDQNEL